MLIEMLATLVYGVFAMIAALVLSSQAGSPLATALVFASAGLAYLFQVVQLHHEWNPVSLQIASIGALLASVFLSLWMLH